VILSPARPRPGPGKLALALEITATYVHVRRRLRAAGLPAVLRMLREVGSRDGESLEMDESLRLGRAVRRTLGLLPGDGRCLTQSLVLTKLLSRRGVSSELVIGITKEEAFAAHAWVEREHVPLLPPFERKFDRLTRL
jgi:hypothetical protein